MRGDALFASDLGEPGFRKALSTHSMFFFSVGVFFFFFSMHVLSHEVLRNMVAAEHRLMKPSRARLRLKMRAAVQGVVGLTAS